MRNASTIKGNAYIPMWHRRTHFQWLGWDDVRRGLPVTKARQKGLDNLPDRSGPDNDPAYILQMNYQQGRTMALVCLKEWGVVPEWNRAKKLFHPEMLDQMRDENGRLDTDLIVAIFNEADASINMEKAANKNMAAAGVERVVRPRDEKGVPIRMVVRRAA